MNKFGIFLQTVDNIDLEHTAVVFLQYLAKVVGVRLDNPSIVNALRRMRTEAVAKRESMESVVIEVYKTITGSNLPDLTTAEMNAIEHIKETTNLVYELKNVNALDNVDLQLSALESLIPKLSTSIQVSACVDHELVPFLLSLMTKKENRANDKLICTIASSLSAIANFEKGLYECTTKGLKVLEKMAEDTTLSQPIKVAINSVIASIRPATVLTVEHVLAPIATTTTTPPPEPQPRTQLPQITQHREASNSFLRPLAVLPRLSQSSPLLSHNEISLLKSHFRVLSRQYDSSVAQMNRSFAELDDIAEKQETARHCTTTSLQVMYNLCYTESLVLQRKAMENDAMKKAWSDIVCFRAKYASMNELFIYERMDRSFRIRSIPNSAGPFQKVTISWIHGAMYLLMPVWFKILKRTGKKILTQPDSTLELIALRLLYEYTILTNVDPESDESVAMYSSTLNLWSNRSGENPSMSSVSEDIVGLVNRYQVVSKKKTTPLCFSFKLTANNNGVFSFKTLQECFITRDFTDEYEFILLELSNFVTYNMDKIFSDPFSISVKEKTVKYNVVSVLAINGGSFIKVDQKMVYAKNGETYEIFNGGINAKPFSLLFQSSTIHTKEDQHLHVDDDGGGGGGATVFPTNGATTTRDVDDATGGVDGVTGGAAVVIGGVIDAATGGAK